MNSRQLFLNTLDCRPDTRTLNWEFAYWGGALNRWYEEGLPKKHGLPGPVHYGQTVCGPGLHWPLPSVADNLYVDQDVSEFFAFDPALRLLPYNHWIFPRFEQEVLDETEDYIDLIDGDGIRKVVRRDQASTPWCKVWPVTDERSWEKLKDERLNPATITDRWLPDAEGTLDTAKSRTYPLAMFGDPVGFYGSVRFLVGEMNLLYWYHDKPELVRGICGHLCDLWIQIAEEQLSVTDFDCCFFWEDMAGRQGSLIGPQLFRRFMTPHYQRLVSFLRGRGVEHFVVDTDGYVGDLIPLFIEAGCTGMYPFEAQAGNDMREYRHKYPRFQIFGGIDKNALAADRTAIDAELEMVRQLLPHGGYVPYADHLVPPNVPWDNYRYFRQHLRDLIHHHKGNMPQ